MPKIITYVCDVCGKEAEKVEVFTKKLPPSTFFNLYVCKDCYEKIFKEKLSKLKGDNNAE